MPVSATVLDYLRVLVWPVVVCGLAVVFRASIKELLSRTRHLVGLGVSASFDAWHETVGNTRDAISAELGAAEASHLGQAQAPAVAVDGSLSPNARVAASASHVERLLQNLLAARREDVKGLSMPQLSSRALQAGLIDANLADSINGLSVMRILAAMDQDRLTNGRAADFAAIAAGIEYLLQGALRRATALEPAAPA